jgi:hypothetical protein
MVGPRNVEHQVRLFLIQEMFDHQVAIGVETGYLLFGQCVRAHGGFLSSSPAKVADTLKLALRQPDSCCERGQAGFRASLRENPRKNIETGPFFQDNNAVMARKLQDASRSIAPLPIARVGSRLRPTDRPSRKRLFRPGAMRPHRLQS